MSPDLAAITQAHGYWILAAGCLFEGETIVALAGFAAHRGHLQLPAVFIVAALAGFAGDQFFFWLGRRHGAAVLARLPGAARQASRVRRLFDRRPAAWIIGVRFAYGLRIVGPILLGTMDVPAARFALFNAVGAILWALLFGSLGWLFGRAAEALLGRVAHFEAGALSIVAIAAVIWLILRRRRASTETGGRDDGA